ncbi:MAG: methyltransferase type 11 [Saprospiraceae bacterium]
MDAVLKNISTNMIERYSNRYKKLGRNIKTLGWGSVEQQLYRFEQTLQTGVDFSDKRILDIGCGFGDYYDYITAQRKIEIQSYQGYDLNDDLINAAQQEYINDSKSAFQVSNILEKKVEEPVADIGVMLGVLNLNFKEEYDNYAYSKKIITNAFSLVKDYLIVDFLSTNLDSSYPKEDFIFYHNPAQMLEFAFSLSENVSLKHDYASIPQKEFMLIIKK